MSLNKMPAPDSGTPAVLCRAITKTFGSTADTEVLALRGVDLEVRAGELYMLVGPSGCGKTSLLSIIAGILNPSAGSCTVLGQDYARLKPSQLIQFRAKNIGFVFQSFNLLPALSAAENAAVPLTIAGWPQAKALARAKEVLAQVGLEHRANALPRELSGGQQQRVAIARAFVHKPAIVVCDEPTSALDHETGQQVMNLFEQARRQNGTTLLIVTHDNRIFRYADRIAHMNDGCIDRMLSPEEFAA